MSRSHIVVTTDFSEHSYDAFEHAADLARRLDAKVTLLHAAPDNLPATYYLPFGLPEPDPELRQIVDRAKADLEELRQRWPEDVDLEVAVTTGSTIEHAILDYATEHGATLLVIASHGRSGLSRLLMGSVAEQVLRHAKIPLLVIPRARRGSNADSADEAGAVPDAD